MDYSEVKKFLVFVEINSEINELESDKILVEKEITKAETLIQHYTSQISNNNVRLSAKNKNYHSLELDLKTVNSQESDKKLKLERISNSREFFAVHQELEEIIKKKSTLEAAYLNSWQEVETLEKEFTEVNKNLELTVATELKEVENFRRRMKSIENQLRDLVKRKDESVKLVDSELLGQYTSMKQSTKNPVVKVKRDSCGGCFYLLSRQDLLSIEQHKLIRCKNCYRIIYNPEEPIE